jgi:hypothetical protein
MKLLATVLLLASAAVVQPADMARIKAEQNLEKRSRLALSHAEDTLKAARKAYDSGDLKRAQALIEESLASVELAHRSLQDTGKDPRRKPKHFKHAEIETRDLLRHVEAFENAMSYDDRQVLQKFKTRTHEIHDELLKGIMQGKKK